MENNTVNYMHVEPDSHFWDRLDTLINYTTLAPEPQSIFLSEVRDFKKDLLIGLKNTKKNGYEIMKKIDHISKEELRSVIEKRLEEINEHEKNAWDHDEQEAAGRWAARRWELDNIYNEFGL